MPYVRKGKCVYKKKPDGSAGAKKGCSSSVAGAKKHLAVLNMRYAGVPPKSKKGKK